MTRKQGYMQAGDALRALAAMMVVVYHVLLGAVDASGGATTRGVSPSVLMRGAYGPTLGDVASHLNAGLFVFFVLTGYFVGGPYVRAWIMGTDAPAPGRYLQRRARRIVPAFWLFAAISILVLHPHDNSVLDVTSIFAFAQNYHLSFTRLAIVQAWTLDIEATFYVALPVIALAAAALLRGRAPQPGRRAVVLVAALALVAVTSLAIQPQYPTLSDSFSMSLPTLLWAFIPGLALAAVEPFVRPALRGTRGRALACALAGASVIGFLLVVRIPTARNVAHCLALMAFGGGIVAAALVWQWATGGAPRWAVNRVTNALGRWSYGIYLCHLVLSIELIKLAPEGSGAKATALLALPLTIAASIAVAALSWRLLERPLLEWRSKPRTAPAPASA